MVLRVHKEVLDIREPKDLDIRVIQVSQGYTGYQGNKGDKGDRGYKGYQGLPGQTLAIEKNHQILEIVSGICDGRQIQSNNITYTLPNITNVQEIGPSNLPGYDFLTSWYDDNSYFYDISGSTISYKPPTGTK